MRKQLIIILFLTIFSSSYSQISIGYNFGFSANNANFSTKKGYEYFNTYLDEMTKLKSTKINFTNSINVNYILNKKWSLESGLEYINKGYKTLENFNFENPNNDPAIPTTINKVDDNHSVSIPISLYYHLGNSKFNYIIGAGLAINSIIYRHEMYTYNYSDGRTRINTRESSALFDNFQISPLITLACQYTLTEKIKLRLSTNYRYDLNDIYPNVSTYKTRLHTATAQLGLYYKLK